MKTLGTLFLVLVGTIVVASPARAQTPPPAKAKGAAPVADPKDKDKVKEMSFEGDVVEAQFIRPDGGIIGVVGPKAHSSLIKVRSDFVDEILKSAEDL